MFKDNSEHPEAISPADIFPGLDPDRVETKPSEELALKAKLLAAGAMGKITTQEDREKDGD